jgi:transposase
LSGEPTGMKLQMSEKERDRLKLMAQLVDPETRMTQAQAAALLNCTARHVRRIVARYREEGDVGLVHKSRGRPSNRRLPEELKQRTLEAIRQLYPDFGPTFAAEKLAEHHDIRISHETLRKWMIEDGLWKLKARKAYHRQFRERKAFFGEMIQIDTSIHDWFEGRGEQAVLICLIDDATSRVFMRFYATDSTATNMSILRDYIARYGRPMTFYGDKASHFYTTRQATVEEQLEAIEPETQIGRALRELDITYISAHSPQAKGRVERSFETAQDRLIKELRLAGINTIETANGFLEEVYMPFVKERFSVKPACEEDVHRPADEFDLDAIFSNQQTRVVTRDYTISFNNQRYQILAESAVAGLVGSRVIVEQRLDGTMRLRYRGSYLQFNLIQPPKLAAAALPLGLRPRSRAAAKANRSVTPAPDHPWRNNLKGAFRSQRQ